LVKKTADKESMRRIKGADKESKHSAVGGDVGEMEGNDGKGKVKNMELESRRTQHG
jgi:hypothetical protein